MNDHKPLSSYTANEAHSKAQPDPVALFVSDLHLHAAVPRTTEAFFAFLKNKAMRTRQLYLLGDIFEYWAGDDDMGTPYTRQVIDALRRVSDAGVEVFWIAGNRDFLAGNEFARHAGILMLPDPFVATIANHRIVLTHGDTMCTDDLSYMAFRAQVREGQWQQVFLSKPLAERKKIIEELRYGSKQAQQTKSAEIMDVNVGAVAAMFAATDTKVMIHGHTHRPARHSPSANGSEATRYVLPDWDCDQEPQRGGWIAIAPDGDIKLYGIDGAIIG